MKVVYICFGRAHSSIVAAAIHLNRLPAKGPPGVDELIGLQLFDQANRDDLGTPLQIGTDENGREIFVLGLNGHRTLCLAAIEGLREILGGTQYDVILVDTLGGIGWMCRIGGFISRRLHWVSIGRPLVAWGIQRSYHNLTRLVQGVKKELVRIEQKEGHLRYGRGCEGPEGG